MRFDGTERYEVTAKLGQGGMGVVYAAYDHDRGMRVALKTLREVDAANLYRLKREFRALRDLSHPNIVALYDLVCDGDQWFYTMELIEGTGFMAHIRARPAAGPGAELGAAAPWAGRTLDSTLLEPSGSTSRSSSRDQPLNGAARPEQLAPAGDGEGAGGSPGSGAATSAAERGPRRGASGDAVAPVHTGEIVELSRLREALGQLARALHALHGAGMVHRDLKPSNVLVDRGGRVVLTDFGVVAELTRPRALSALVPSIAGTPAFMAPEQLRGAPPSRASDWYAFGVMIYRALAGRLPFGGRRDRDVIDRVLAGELVPIAAATRGAPADLAALCEQLLARDPAARPSGEHVLSALATAAVPADRGVLPGGHGVFVGRTRELAALRAVYDAVAGAASGTRDDAPNTPPNTPIDRTSAVAIVRGVSGMGKTHLVDRFLDGVFALANDGGPLRAPLAPRPALAVPVVLSSRCHPNETLPYNAFDGAIDDLSDYLTLATARAPAPVSARDLAAIARIFPVLARVRRSGGGDAGAGDERSPDDPTAPPDASAQRALAVAALRGLLAALARQRPLVVRIEDLQWAGADSLALLAEVMAAPAPPGVLILATLRAESTAEQRAALDGALARVDPALAVHFVELGPLAAGEQRELLARLAPETDGAHPALGEPLIRELGGHPMLLAEIAHHLRTAGGPAGEPALVGERGLRLHEVIARRIAGLAPAVRALVEALAVAGEPLPLRAVADAAGLTGGERERAIATGCASRLLVRLDADGAALLGCFHDAIAEAVRAGLSELRTRMLARALAQALAGSLARSSGALAGGSDPAERSGGAVTGPGDRARPAALLGRLLLLAGEPEAAARYLIEAAERASAALALGRAEALYRDVLAALADAPGDRASDALRCRAWLGLAEGMRVVDRGDEALALLDRAEQVARRHDLTGERATLHFLRGSLLFPRGDIAGCAAEQERAREFAARAGDPALEARALSGLGDALWLRGKPRAAYARFARCVALCREHGLAAIELANLAMRGQTRAILFELEAGIADCETALALATRHGARRVAVVASVVLGSLLVDAGRFDDACERLAQCRARARDLGAARFEPLAMALAAKALLALGRRDEALALAGESAALARASSPAFSGPTALAVRALATGDPDVRARCLAEGEALLAAGSPCHNHLWFYREAIEACLEARELAAAARYADAIDDYGRDEALPYTRLVAARGRALVRCYASEPAFGGWNPGLARDLRALRDEARAVGFGVVLPRLDAAVAAL